MTESKAIPSTVDDYIAGFPPSVQSLLQQIRATIREAAPDATETIKYAMPTYALDGNLVYFAGFARHIGFYATPTGQEAFKAELTAYRTGKGSVQLPLDQPIPHDLIRRMVEFRVQENKAKTAAKKKR